MYESVLANTNGNPPFSHLFRHVGPHPLNSRNHIICVKIQPKLDAPFRIVNKPLFHIVCNFVEVLVVRPRRPDRCGDCSWRESRWVEVEKRRK